MQKYYIRDFLTKELEKNDGKLTQYYVENDHEAIIEREIWDAAQLVSQRENLLSGWEKDIAQGNTLERLRAAQMKELTEKYPDWFQVAKNTRMVIGEIIIGGDKGCEILFMDGVRLVTDQSVFEKSFPLPGEQAVKKESKRIQQTFEKYL